MTKVPDKKGGAAAKIGVVQQTLLKHGTENGLINIVREGVQSFFNHPFVLKKKTWTWYKGKSNLTPMNIGDFPCSASPK